VERYAKSAGAVFSLKYHIVWCPKYRRCVLVPPVDKRLKTAAEGDCRQPDMMAMEVMPDHVHVFVETDVRRAAAEIAAKFKAN
jgi:putative transposase